jgi:hypothetical protein
MDLVYFCFIRTAHLELSDPGLDCVFAEKFIKVNRDSFYGSFTI